MNVQAAALVPESDVIADVIRLPRAMPKVLGMGAHLKASQCLIDGDTAYITHPAGDMETLDAVERYQFLLGEMVERAGGAGQIQCWAHDLHPDFHSTRMALERDARTLAVQHHHAHIVATAIENGYEDAVLGLALDGFGLGTKEESWGGELLRVDGHTYSRIGHLSRMAQPGGDIAAREPWRMGAAALHDLGRGDEIAERFAGQAHASMLSTLLSKGLNSPLTSSCGRLFDAACGLLDVRPVADFEGQAPMELESLVTEPEVLEGGWSLSGDGKLGWANLLNVLPGMDATQGANLFHGTLIAGMTDWVLSGRAETGINAVAFGGGCFLNRVLTAGLTKTLQGAGMTVLKPVKLSPGDAGLSFGQAYVAARVLEQGK